MLTRNGLIGVLAAMLSATSGLAGCESTNVDEMAEGEISVAEKEQALTLDIDFQYMRLLLEHEFMGVNDEMVRYKRYEYIGNEDAYVIYLNGRTEFIEKYDPMFTAIYEQSWETSQAETLADLPITFFAIDHTGQGESGGLPSHIDDYQIYVDNVHRLIQNVHVLNKHKKPIYLMGRSMGGLIAARFAQQHPDLVDGLIFASPMFGVNPPPGTDINLLKMLASAYTQGFGMGNRCARAVDPMILGMIATCQSDPTGTCQGCMQTGGAAEGCGEVTFPISAELQIPFDWANMGAGMAYLRSEDSIGCKKYPSPEYAEGVCKMIDETTGEFNPNFNGTTSDYDYCFWMQSNQMAGPDMTFGWLHASFQATDEVFKPQNLDKIRGIPNLILSSPIDPIVTPASHHAMAQELSSCNPGECDNIVEFQSNPAEGLFYFHELLAERDRASVITAIRTFLTNELGL